MKSAVWIAFVATATGIILAGCSGGTQAPFVAKDFTLKDLSGGEVTLSSFRGKANVLIHFGTTWCPPCVEEIPDLTALDEQYSDEELVILYVDVNEAEDLVRNFITEHKIGYTTLLDADGAVGTAYNVTGIPANFLVDKEGMVQSASVAIPHEAIRGLAGR